MTRTEIYELIQSFGISSTYYSFPTNEAPALPYVIYYYPNRDDIFADNENYVKVELLRIELYTDTRDFTTEDSIEALLPFPYSKEVVYIDSEKMYQITYETEVILTEEEVVTLPESEEEVIDGE